MDQEYHWFINMMKELKRFLQKKYQPDFTFGNVYQGNPDYSYFSLTTADLKKQKLKFVLICNHKDSKIEICLSGQNKAVRKKYWNSLKVSTGENFTWQIL